MSFTILPYREEHWPGAWQILEPIFRCAETYAVDPEITESAARSHWTAGSTTGVFIAQEADSGEILGTYYLAPNNSGPGAHVCNCGYAVSELARGQGIASAMCEHSQAEGRRAGFRAMQFNLVAASNPGAVRLWHKLGFDTVGTLPGAFKHPMLGYVDAYVMYKDLSGTPD